MRNALSRREFLKLTGLSFSSLAFISPPPEVSQTSLGLGRVTVGFIYLFSEPSFQADKLTKLKRDTLVTLLSREIPDEGPSHNPVWYLLPNGYAHSGSIQRVQWRPQTPRLTIPEGGAPFEVTVPYTRSYRKPDPSSDPLYRLYINPLLGLMPLKKVSTVDGGIGCSTIF